MNTLKTQELTEKLRNKTLCIKENIQYDATRTFSDTHTQDTSLKNSNNVSSSIYNLLLSFLLSIPYGLCYGYLTYTLLNYAYSLFLSHVIQVVFFVVLPAWTLIIPAVMTGSVYWLIGQYEFNNLLVNKEDSEKNIFLMLLGLLVGVFIGVEFFEFLPFANTTSLIVAMLAGFTHFTVFFNNAAQSVNKLEMPSDPLSFISLAAPILAIINVIFITGLFHPVVYAFFSIGVSSVFVKKLYDYKALSPIRRIYAAFDATIREYTALIIHCIGEGAIPAAAATHSSSSLTIFLAQLSGLVATSNEYFTDYHTVAGQHHKFTIYEYGTSKGIYACIVFEKNGQIDYDQSFFFESNSVETEFLKSRANALLNDHFNGVFEFVDNYTEEKYSVTLNSNKQYESDEDPEEGHSHGLDYKPVLQYFFGLSITFVDQIYKKFTNNYQNIILGILAFLFAGVAFFMTTLPLALIHQVVLFPFVYGGMIQIINFTSWILYSNYDDKLIDINYFVTNLLDPINWLNNFIYFTVFFVACCIGINGGTEFATHLAFMFSTSPIVLPTIISVFIICALLTEGVWINNRLNKALKPIKSYFQPTQSDQLRTETSNNIADQSPKNDGQGEQSNFQLMPISFGS